MAEQPSRKSAFALARRSTSVTVELTTQDLLHIRPDLSRTEAEDFLKRNGTAIAEQMLAAGLRAAFTPTRAPLEEELDKFLAEAAALAPDARHRKWLESPQMKAYVRKSRRVIENRPMTTLDISGVRVDEAWRGKGLFTAFINRAHQLNPWDATFVENVYPDRLAGFLWCHDWLLVNEFVRAFYRRKNQGQFEDAWTRLHLAQQSGDSEESE